MIQFIRTQTSSYILFCDKTQVHSCQSLNDLLGGFLYSWLLYVLYMCPVHWKTVVIVVVACSYPLLIYPCNIEYNTLFSCFFLFFSVRLLSVLCDHSCFFSSPPQRPMTSDFEGFLSQILSITFFVLYLFFRKSQYFPF